jgi:hypothetical protein
MGGKLQTVTSKRWIIAVHICLLALLWPGRSARGAEPKGFEWNSIRGVNFIPFYARSSEEIWENYNHNSMERDLKFAAGLGFNSVRVSLHYEAFRRDPQRMVDSFADFLRLCNRYKLSVLPVLFDSCGLSVEANSTVMTSGDAYQRFLADPALPAATKARLKKTYGEFALGRGAAVLVPVGRKTPVDVLIWGWWTPSPGLARLTRDNWSQLDGYLDKIMGGFQKDPAIIAWDIMNEPGTVMELPDGVTQSQAESHITDFLNHASQYVRTHYHEKPLTVGAENLERMKASQPYLDLLSLHVYKPFAETQHVIEEARAFANQTGKPLLITECLANTNDWLTVFGDENLANDAGQLAHYQKFLPLLMQSHLGWYSWGFITGHLFGGFVDIIDPNGYRRPAAVYLQRILSTEIRK